MYISLFLFDVKTFLRSFQNTAFGPYYPELDACLYLSCKGGWNSENAGTLVFIIGRQLLQHKGRGLGITTTMITYQYLRGAQISQREFSTHVKEYALDLASSISFVRE